MKFLRTISTRRLLALIAGLVSAIAAGAAIAVAAAGTGPVPVKEPLSKAVHDALAAPKVGGLTARISFTNHLIDATDIQGANPILSGATGRLWLSNDHRLRLELQSTNGDAQVVAGNGAFWVYDPSSNTVYKGTLPQHSGATAKDKTGSDQVPSIAQIQSYIGKLAARANLSGAIPGDVAGHAAYTVRISPRHDAGLLGAGELAWDAVKGVPLRFAVYARNDSRPVLELKATDISYGGVKSSVFNISPPSGAKVVKINTASSNPTGPKVAVRSRRVAGVGSVARHVPFALVAPSNLVGLPRRSVSLLDWNGKPAALVAYGQNLGGIAVIEQTADTPTGASPSSTGNGDHRGLNLPTVSINGTTGEELDTALGTMVRFTRGGVSYTVIGSVPPAAADAAARAL